MWAACTTRLTPLIGITVMIISDDDDSSPFTMVNIIVTIIIINNTTIGGKAFQQKTPAGIIRQHCPLVAGTWSETF